MNMLSSTCPQGGFAGVMVQQPVLECHQDQEDDGRFQEGEAEVPLLITNDQCDPGGEGEQLYVPRSSYL